MVLGWVRALVSWTSRSPHDLHPRPIGPDELDDRGSAQQGVAGPVDRAHAPLSDLLLQGVVPELLGAGQLALQPLGPARVQEDPEGGEDEKQDDAVEGPAQDHRGAEGLGAVDLGGQAEPVAREPGPGPHDLHPPVVAVSLGVHTGPARRGLGRGEGERPRVLRPLGLSAPREVPPGIADLEVEDGSPRIEDPRLPQLAFEPAGGEHAPLGVECVALAAGAEPRAVEDGGELGLRPQSDGQDREDVARFIPDGSGHEHLRVPPGRAVSDPLGPGGAQDQGLAAQDPGGLVGVEDLVAEADPLGIEGGEATPPGVEEGEAPHSHDAPGCPLVEARRVSRRRNSSWSGDALSAASSALRLSVWSRSAISRRAQEPTRATTSARRAGATQGRVSCRFRLIGRRDCSR
jgi:hypothetical protein